MDVLPSKEGKLRSIIAFHDTTLGPALGGTRMYPYQTEDEAVLDALRLSKGMTLKSEPPAFTTRGAKGSSGGTRDRQR
jgi:leucine dehydrogenase